MFKIGETFTYFVCHQESFHNTQNKLKMRYFNGYILYKCTPNLYTKFKIMLKLKSHQFFLKFVNLAQSWQIYVLKKKV